MPGDAMCHDRERLIDYIYDECGAGERREIEDHLAGCPACRQEAAGLRAVRQDLLAWDVPSHASIWRPVTPARVSWRAVPGWAFAAAASLMLLSGAAGGAIAQALLARPGAVVGERAAVQPAAMPAGMPAAAALATPATVDVADLERRVAARIRGELQADLDARMQRIAFPRESAPSREMLDLMTRLNNEVVGVQVGLHRMESKVEGVMALADARAMPVSFQGQ